MNCKMSLLVVIGLMVVCLFGLCGIDYVDRISRL